MFNIAIFQYFFITRINNKHCDGSKAEGTSIVISWCNVEVQAKSERQVQVEIGEICFTDFLSLADYGNNSLKKITVYV